MPRNLLRHSTTDSSLVALLATGDEVCDGDILNSNAQRIAQKLLETGIQVGAHLVVRDNLKDIQTAIHFLLQQHQAIIMTGGLGPTSDDLTRQALAMACNRELVFDEATWRAITARLQYAGYTEIPESNRQQAFFPEGSNIISNPNGTAAGCLLRDGEKTIFMLPGPPNECLPMVDTTVLPILKKQGFEKKRYYKKWLLFGVSEGWIAGVLDEIAEPFDCVTGYRFCYPYVECKVYSNDEAEFEKVVYLIQPVIKNYLIEDGKSTASELLKKRIMMNDYILHIEDTATGGYLENVLRTPENDLRIHFYNIVELAKFNKNNIVQIKIKGLIDFWKQKKESAQTKLSIEFFYQGKQQIIQENIPLRGEQVKAYAVEYISKKIIAFLV